MINVDFWYRRNAYRVNKSGRFKLLTVELAAFTAVLLVVFYSEFKLS